MLPNHIDGVIFDMDGTLVSSSLNFHDICDYLNVPKGTDVLAHVQTLESQSRKVAEAYLEQQELEDAANSSWLPHAKNLVEALKDQGYPTAILTRNSRQATELKVSSNQIPVDLVLSREDAEAKPNPDGLFKAAARLSLDPARTVYVGDYIYDLQAARNAGMISCFYAGGYQDPDRYKPFLELADVVCHDYRRFHTLF